ncbi:MAG: hypothetical protein E6Z15_10440, partial [Paenibacillus macerans]|nr:hypothetical protein [Paenibacillus macerans]
MSILGTLRIVYHYWLTRRRRKWSSRVRLERWQERRVIRHIRWVRANSAFYREWWNGLEDSAWRSFPLMDKA